MHAASFGGPLDTKPPCLRADPRARPLEDLATHGPEVEGIAIARGHEREIHLRRV